MAVTEPGGNDGCATQAPSPIENNMNRIENELGEFHNRLDTLYSRLSPIMDSPKPTAESCGSEKTNKGGSGLSGRLSSAKESISKEVDIINDILQRLEV